MELKDIVSITGMGGLFEVTAQRPDGLIVRHLDEEQSKFVSNRIHVFTPLDGITIYTEDDTVELAKVLPEMKKQEKDNPPVDVKSDNDTLKGYFKKILPEYDDERVYVSDIKKIIKWYDVLKKHNLIEEEKPEETKAEDSPAEAKTEEKPEDSKQEEAKPKPAAKKKTTPPEATDDNT